jgi:N-acetylglucosaminyl-diphospho-decaprenol L-rhamnosyltransferase
VPDGTEAGWAAVIVNYNAGSHLVDCVESVLGDASAGPVEVVVVDNDSRDGSTEALEKSHPDVRVVRSGANLGYARAANRGIAATGADVVAVLNPDTVLLPGAAAALVTRLRAEPDVGAVGPQLRNPDGSVYPSARSVPPLRVAVGHGLLGSLWPRNPWTRRYRQLDADPDRGRDVDWVSGAAVWLRREALDAVGGWDERYFMYVEDVDLCWRLRRAGWRVVYEPAARVVHVLAVSTTGAPYRMIVEHHRSLYRFASHRWVGPRRALLPAAGAFLALRAAAAMGEHRLRRTLRRYARPSVDA